jgi:tetratricopeptide (TPR) repeat protein
VNAWLQTATIISSAVTTLIVPNKTAMRKLILFSFLSGSLYSFGQQNSQTVSPDQVIADSLYQLNDFKKALSLYEKVVKQINNNAVVWHRLGYCYHNTGKYADALRCYEQSLGNNPGPMLKQFVQSRMARIYSLQKNNLKAIEHLKESVSLGYSNLSELETNADFAFLRSVSGYKIIHDTIYNRAFPCMADSNARKFDFWIGEWNAYQNGTTNLAGYSKIEIASGGCMILENWTSAIGSFSGKSMNYFMPETGKWEQTWVGSEATRDRPNRFVNGEYKDGAMRFEFSGKDQDGDYIGRFIFYNLGQDKVRQFSEQSHDMGKTWMTNYDFLYIRKK